MTTLTFAQHFFVALCCDRSVFLTMVLPSVTWPRVVRYICVISSFSHVLNEICAFLAFYATYISSLFKKRCSSWIVLSPKKGPISWSVSSVLNYQSTLCRIPAERRSKPVDSYRPFVRTSSPHLWASKREDISFTRKIEAAVFSKPERLYYAVLCHRRQKLSIVSWSLNSWHVRTLTFSMLSYSFLRLGACLCKNKIY
jgi:hypothetical protein